MVRPAWRGVRLRSWIRKRLNPSEWMREIRHRHRRPAGHAAADHHVAVEPLRRDRLIIERFLDRPDERDMGGGDDVSQQFVEPVLGNDVDGPPGEGVFILALDDELVAAELGMALPFEPKIAQIGGEVIDPRFGRLRPEPPGKVAHLLPLPFAQREIAGDGQEGQARRRGQRFGRPGMDFVVQGETIRMLTWRLHPGLSGCVVSTAPSILTRPGITKGSPMKFWQMVCWMETEQLVEIARFAEALGFEGVMNADHAIYPETVNARYPYSPTGKPLMSPDWEYPGLLG